MEFIALQGDHIPKVEEIERSYPAPGSQDLGVRIHRTRFLLQGLDDDFLDSAGPVFESFIDPSGAGAEREITVRFGLADRETFLIFPTAPRPERYRILVASAGEAYRFISYHFAALYRPSEHTVRVILARGPGLREERLLDNLFRVLASYAFIEQGAVLVHGAALARDDRGYVFFGPSGSGKTTVSRLSRDRADLLSDDQALLSVEEDQVILSGTPFRGGERVHAHRYPEAIPGPNDNRSVPLAGLFRLVQSDRVAVRPLAPSRQVASLLSSVPVFPGEPFNNARLMTTLGRIIERRPVRDLLFRPDPSFWDVVADDQSI